MMDHRIGRLAALAGAAAMALGVAAPAAAASPAPLTAVVAEDATGAPAAGQAWIRVLHGSPDAPAVDVYVDGTKAISDLAFGNITDYTPVPVGDHAIKVCATGSTTVCPIDLPALALADSTKYTIAATNDLAEIQAQVLEDAPATDATDQAQVRVVHFSADTPAVDVIVDDTTKLVTGLTYPNASPYATVAGATYSVKVCASPADTLCPLGPLSLNVTAGKAYSVFAIGSLAALTASPSPSASASPAASTTPPPTDTVAGTDGTSTGGTMSALVVLAAIALASLGVSLPLGARRIRR
jgi:hypothetical protein